MLEIENFWSHMFQDNEKTVDNNFILECAQLLSSNPEAFDEIVNKQAEWIKEKARINYFGKEKFTFSDEVDTEIKKYARELVSLQMNMRLALPILMFYSFKVDDDLDFNRMELRYGKKENKKISLCIAPGIKDINDNIIEKAEVVMNSKKIVPISA